MFLEDLKESAQLARFLASRDVAFLRLKLLKTTNKIMKSEARLLFGVSCALLLTCALNLSINDNDLSSAEKVSCDFRMLSSLR